MAFKISEILVLILLFGCAGLLGIQSYHVSSAFSKPISFELNGNQINMQDQPYYGDLTDLAILGKRFAENHDYNKTEYNCKNYSTDFKFIADHLGFDVEIEWGCKNENLTDCHAWNVVKVPYEPQSGEFKDVQMEYPFGR